MRLADKIALVTGAGSGMGACIAETFAREGARVAVVDIDVDAAKTVARAIGNTALALGCDVAKSAEIDTAIRSTLAAFDRIDILVNNAGVAHVNKPVTEISEAELDRVLAVNVKGVFLFSQAMVPVFRRQGGGVMINIGSTAGLRPRPGLSAYNATKGAVHNLTKTLAVELAPTRSASARSRRSRPRRRCWRPSSARRPASGRSSRRPCRSGGWRSRRTSPMWRSSSPPTRRRSSPAISSRWMAGGAYSACPGEVDSGSPTRTCAQELLATR